MAEHPSDPPESAAQPISLRDSVPLLGEKPQPRGSQSIYVFGVALVAVILLAIVLIAVSGSGSNDNLNENDVRAIVQEVVGTQVAALPMSSGGGLSAEQMQQLISIQVSTQVAALQPTNTPIPPTPTVIPPGVAEDDDPYLGPENAPVVIVEFSDFQCGYCGRWYQDTLPQILQAYPTQVKFVYRDFPIFGEDSFRAAMATQCANDQGKFWEMHNRLFEREVNQEETPLSEAGLDTMASELGLDLAAFSECLSSQRYYDEVVADYQTAVDYGLRGTPGFVIDGVVYTIGAQPFEIFDQIIQAELLKASSS
jgi:protein-disulfide isomerase